MKHQIKKLKLTILGIVAIAGSMLLFDTKNCSAVQLSYSPIRYNKILVPGSTEDLFIKLTVPGDAERTAFYELEIKPFYIDDEGNTHFEAKGSYSEIINWIAMSKDDMKGAIKPNESKQINYTIAVPESAPAGGQYAVIVVKTYDDAKSDIKQVYQLTQAIYAEVAGETHRQGEIASLMVPSLLFSGEITGTATIKNLGNVHSSAMHSLRVYPLFGDEELYTNEEEPYESLIMPEATRQSSVSWNQTPRIGIFRVKYAVEFEGVKNELEKVIIVCPLWLLVIILLFIVTIIYRVITDSRKKSSKKAED